MCQSPIYSTSVNRSGQPVLTGINEISREFENDVALIVDDGDCKTSIPSTIVRIDDGEVVVVRKGAVEIN